MEKADFSCREDSGKIPVSGNLLLKIRGDLSA
jgi:hypothetical protein